MSQSYFWVKRVLREIQPIRVKTVEQPNTFKEYYREYNTGAATTVVFSEVPKGEVWEVNNIVAKQQGAAAEMYFGINISSAYPLVLKRDSAIYLNWVGSVFMVAGDRLEVVSTNNGVVLYALGVKRYEWKEAFRQT